MSAPRARQASSFARDPAVTATPAPACLASWIAIVPMPLPPPRASSVSAAGGAAGGGPPRDRKQLSGRDGYPLGVAAAGQQRADLLADMPSVDAVAEGRDGARALEARIGRRARRGRGGPRT